MKVASALLKNGKVFIQAYSETTSGVWIGFGPVHTCGIDQAKDMGTAACSALELSKRGVPHPTQEGWKEIQQPMLNAVGARSWPALSKGARAVGLECQDGVVTITPSRNYGTDGANDLVDQTITAPLNPESVGAGLKQAFELSS